MNKPINKILVIKLGALGDFIQATGPFAAIRRHHAEDDITLITTEAFAEFAEESPWFDRIKIDSRPKTLQIGKWLALRNWLKSENFSRVIDLQTSDRSSFYHKMYSPGPYPEWSGIASGCSHPHDNPKRDFMHTIERQKEQLSMAGIAGVELSDFSWIDAEFNRFGVDEKFALLAPGGALHRPGKRWPQENFATIIKHLAANKIQPVLIGGENEITMLEELKQNHPTCMSLAGKTSIIELIALAKKATLAIGNDTGPMHVTAASGCKTIVLFSDESDPALCAQRGPDVTIHRVAQLSDLEPEKVIQILNLN